MVSLQIISKILATGSNQLVEDNLLTNEFFVGYEKEFDFIQEHYKEYGNIPDKATFLANFPDIELVEVMESDKYLIDTIQEEFLYYKSVPVLQKAAELLKSDSNAAAEYMIHALKDLQPNYRLGGVDIIADAEKRYQQYIDRRDHEDEWFFTSGFEELDDLTKGIQRKEELIVIVARTNQGKSWILEKMCTHVWQLGFNVGYVSPEMSGINVGYRFDTLYKNYSNSTLMFGRNDLDESEYIEYLKELTTHENKFIVSTPIDFDRKITVSKLRNYVKQYNLDLLAIDGIKYLTDERYKRGDNMTTSLTNISEDLIGLSMEIGVPIIVVVQSNRTGVKGAEDKGTPELESIRDSDGIAQNATKVYSIRQYNNELEIGIKKQRFGVVGKSVKYAWNIDIGDFTFIPESEEEPEYKYEENKKESTPDNVVPMKRNSDVF